MNKEKLAVAAEILKKAGCKESYLFGSQVRNTTTKWSDIDIGVTGLPPSQFFRVHLQLETALNMKVDLVDFDYQYSFFELLQNIGEIRKIG